MPANGAAVALSVLRALVAARAERCAAAALPRDGGRHVPALRCERRGRKRAHFRTAGRVSGRRADGRGAVRTRRDRSGGSRAAARVLQQLRPRLFSRRVRHGGVRQRAGGSVSLPHSRRRGACDRGPAAAQPRPAAPEGRFAAARAVRPRRGAPRSGAELVCGGRERQRLCDLFHGAAAAPVAHARACCAAAAAARGAVRLCGDDERRERPARHTRGLCALRRYHELGRAERAGADASAACGERPVRTAVRDRKGGAGARRRPARAARGAAAFRKGLAPRRRRGDPEGAAFAAPLTL